MENTLDTPPVRMAIDDMVGRDMESKLEEIRQPIAPFPIDPPKIEETIIGSKVLHAMGYRFESIGEMASPSLRSRRWQMRGSERVHEITFYPEGYDGEGTSIRQASRRFLPKAMN